MLEKYDINKVLFFDIETVSQTSTLDELDKSLVDHWLYKHDLLKNISLKNEEYTTPEESFQNRSAIYAEFGKVICISCGYIKYENDQTTASIKTFFSEDEKEILINFKDFLEKWLPSSSQPNSKFRWLCGHNIKEFDIPYLARRIIIQDLHPLPEVIDLSGKKPWEIQHIDTMELWKFGDYKNFTKLGLLTDVLNIPSPKENLSGDQVGKAYWIDKRYNAIKDYCAADVVATMQLYLRLIKEPLLSDNQISYN